MTRINHDTLRVEFDTDGSRSHWQAVADTEVCVAVLSQCPPRDTPRQYPHVRSSRSTGSHQGFLLYYITGMSFNALSHLLIAVFGS
jgi:hypothetical protein